MAERVTRCPHCGTSFRINDEQLSSAGGAVRCGSCLQIFRALDHLITGQAAPQKLSSTESGTETSKKLPAKPNNPPPQPVEPKKPEVKAPAEDQLISDDMETDDEKEPLFDDDLSDSFLTASRQTNSRTLFDREIRAREDEEDDKDKTDESWAEALLQEINDDTPEETPTPPQTFASQRFALVPDTDEDDVSRQQHAPENAFDNSNTADNDPANDDPLLDHKAMQGIFADAPDTKKLYNRIEPEILELHALPPSPHWKIRWLWPGLCVLAALCVLGQVAFFQFDSLSRLSPYRSLYSAICPVLGCQLPDLIDVNKVRTYNLVMRAHPQQQNALIVDALLINNAAYQQPFPQLALEFSNLQGQLMAGRHFAPAEYLGGEMAGNNLMPVNQPIHISLEIVRPDSDAVNYTLSPTQ